MEGCHVIIFISQNRNPNFPQTLAATINLHGSCRCFRPPHFMQHQSRPSSVIFKLRNTATEPPSLQNHRTTIFSPPWTNLDGSRFIDLHRSSVTTRSASNHGSTTSHGRASSLHQRAPDRRRRTTASATLPANTTTMSHPHSRPFLARLHLLHSRNLHAAASSPQCSYSAPHTQICANQQPQRSTQTEQLQQPPSSLHENNVGNNNINAVPSSATAAAATPPSSFTPALPVAPFKPQQPR
ncbi:hypothetical protein DEO72_LG2g2735 [Vigna unguiculata]|uniref:Uncharacterized protein n=1 Tax=Vigna unguiculata TaxID=3917 RepID=A0A4D6L1L3_VIGUN|nr:hypothetical protein DEO72_LG2g2735 [Vigna unguiculata]